MEYIALCASLFLKNALISERKFVTLCTGIGLSFLLFCHYKDTHFLQQTEIPMPFLCTNTSYYCQLAKLEPVIFLQRSYVRSRDSRNGICLLELLIAECDHRQVYPEDDEYSGYVYACCTGGNTDIGPYLY